MPLAKVSSPPQAAPATPAARHPTPARRASRRRPAACADCARLARLGEPPVAPAGVPGETWLYISILRGGAHDLWAQWSRPVAPRRGLRG